MEPLHFVIGESPIMQQILATLRTIAVTDLPILLVGESGTGKKLLARYIHQESPRGAVPFVAVDCGAVQRDLLDSDLFGHERGAFTGAHAQRKGHIEIAQGGSLFLDDIIKLPLSLEARLTSFLDEGFIERLGGNHPIRLDVRLLAACEEDLSQAAREGRFKRELYVKFVVINLPPLRERKHDIPALLDFFLKKCAEKHKKQVKGYTREAQDLLVKYDYPGNIRELENVVERAVVLTCGEYLSREDFPMSPTGEKRVVDGGMKQTVETAERKMILEALVGASWVQTRAASAIGISERMLRYKMKKLGIHREGTQ